MLTKSDDSDNDYIVIEVDSTAIEVTNRDKLNIKEKGYLKKIFSCKCQEQEISLHTSNY